MTRIQIAQSLGLDVNQVLDLTTRTDSDGLKVIDVTLVDTNG